MLHPHLDQSGAHVEESSCLSADTGLKQLEWAQMWRYMSQTWAEEPDSDLSFIFLYSWKTYEAFSG